MSDSGSGSPRKQVLTYNLKDGKVVLWSTGLGEAFVLVSANQSLVNGGHRVSLLHQRVKLNGLSYKQQGCRGPGLGMLGLQPLPA